MNRYAVASAIALASLACADATTKAQDDLTSGTWESDSVVVATVQGISSTMRVKLRLAPGSAYTELRSGNLYSNGMFVQDSGPICNATTTPVITGNMVQVTYVDPPQLTCLRYWSEDMTAVYTRRPDGTLHRMVRNKAMTLFRK